MKMHKNQLLTLLSLPDISCRGTNTAQTLVREVQTPLQCPDMMDKRCGRTSP